MNMDQARERILLNEQGKAREQAVAEAMALKYRYEGSFYTFEYAGQFITARFVSACLQATDKPNSGYRIELLTSPETLVDGPCLITDVMGRRLNALAFTTRGDYENLITIETTDYYQAGKAV
jgi:hypothetical protein